MLLSQMLDKLSQMLNDLPDHLDCNVSLFADDTLIYQEVTSPEEEKRFQHNIDNLLEWSID